MPPKKRNQTSPGIRTSPRGRGKRRARTTKQSVAESPGTRAKRKEKETRAKANAEAEAEAEVEAEAEAEADAEANAKAASKASKQKKEVVGRKPNKAKKASQKKYAIPKKYDVVFSSNTDGSDDEESYVEKDSEVDDEDDAGEKKRKNDAREELDIEDESSDSDMADTFTEECRKINELVAKRRAQQDGAADPSRNEEEDGSRKRRKESNRRAHDGAADPSSDEEDGSQKQRVESNGRAQDGASDPSSDEEDGSRRRRMQSNRRAQEGEANPSSDREDGSRKRRKESNRRAQDGAADPSSDDNNIIQTMSTPPWASNNDGRDERLNAELEIPTVEKNVRQRITIFVKNNLFRKIKFITSQAAFTRAFRKVLLVETPKNPLVFQLTYEKCFTKALNQKRSTCEQAASQITREAIRDFNNRGEEFFTFEEFCTLRRATSDREKRAFFWFFNAFLECVCGANIWRTAKTTQLVSAARETNGSKIVSISDEAFGLLLIDNYFEKWQILAEGDVEDTEPAQQAGAGTGRGKKKANSRRPGKYTKKALGHCKYGGWNSNGIQQFNALRKLVEQDRACPQAEQMEKELLAFCRTSAGGKKKADNNQDNQLDGNRARNNAQETVEAMVPVEADWDSDDD